MITEASWKRQSLLAGVGDVAVFLDGAVSSRVL